MSEVWEESLCPVCGAKGKSRVEGILQCSACFARLEEDVEDDEDGHFVIGEDLEWDNLDEEEALEEEMEEEYEDKW